MVEKVLFVDDDEKILSAFKRQMRGKFDVATAPSAEEGLELVNRDGPFAVIIADLKMPGMNGIQFLSKIMDIHPETVRIILTGYANLSNAMEAVNKGNIFQFLTKPCPTSVMDEVLQNATRQYRLLTAERVLLEKTLNGIIRVLTEILAAVNPLAYGRSSRIKKRVADIAGKMGIRDAWMLETAAMLSQIGLVAAPQESLENFYAGKKLSKKEMESFRTHPSISSEWVGKIPRMEEIAKIIAYQEKHYDGTGYPDDSTKTDEIPVGSRILKVASDYDRLESSGLSTKDSISKMNKLAGFYDPSVLSTLADLLNLEIGYNVKYLLIQELKPGMVVAKDIISKSIRAPILTRGQILNEAFISRLMNIHYLSSIEEPVAVIDSTTPSINDENREEG